MKCFVCNEYVYGREAVKTDAKGINICGDCSEEYKNFVSFIDDVNKTKVNDGAALSMLSFWVKTMVEKKIKSEIEDLRNHIDRRFEDMMPRGAGRE